MTDIIFCMEGNKDYLEKDIINIRKYKYLAEILFDFLKYLNGDYEFAQGLRCVKY